MFFEDRHWPRLCLRRLEIFLKSETKGWVFTLNAFHKTCSHAFPFPAILLHKKGGGSQLFGLSAERHWHWLKLPQAVLLLRLLCVFEREPRGLSVCVFLCSSLYWTTKKWPWPRAGKLVGQGCWGGGGRVLCDLFSDRQLASIFHRRLQTLTHKPGSRWPRSTRRAFP